MNNLQLLKLMIISMLFLSQVACAISTDDNGRMIEKNYTVAAFDAIDSEIVGNIEVVQTSETTVAAAGDQRFVENLIVKVEDQKLKLSMKENLKSFKLKGKTPKLTVYVSTPELKLIESEGVGNIKLLGDIRIPVISIHSEGVGNISSENLDADHVKIDSRGVGNITLKGTTNELTIQSEGVGNVKTDKMSARHARVKSEGIGNVSCHASESVDIESGGIGNVSYYGNPEAKSIHKEGVGGVSAK